MMIISVRRIQQTKEETLSEISVDGKLVCYGLEDQAQLGEKVYGETRIPTGSYIMGLRKEGGMNVRYSRRFPATHRGMLHIKDVPGFTYIYIHIGNSDTDTSGCILVGRKAVIGATRRVTVRDSMPAYIELYDKVVGNAEAGTLGIEIN